MTAFLMACSILGVVSALDDESQTAIRSLSSIELDLEKLGKWGTQEYVMFGAVSTGSDVHEEIGTLTLSTHLTDKTLEIEDVNAMEHRVVSYTARCRRNSYLSIEVLHVNLEKKSSSKVIRAEVDGNKIKVDQNLVGIRSQRENEWDDEAILGHAMFRIVTLLPREKGARYHIYLASTVRASLRGRCVLSCEGESKLGDQDCTQFVLHRSNDTVEMTYWVTQEGHLEQVTAYDGDLRIQRRPKS